MGNCVALKGNSGTEKCGEPTEAGYKYCEEHRQTRKRGNKEREVAAIGNIVDASQAFGGELIQQPQQGRELSERDIPLEQQNVYDKVQTELNDLIQWKNKTKDMMFTLHQEDFRYTDKAGAEQLHSFVTLYERAQDRVLRGVTAVAKLGIEAQSVNVNKMLIQLIQGCVVKALRKHGMDEFEVEKVRQLVSDEFEKVDREAS